ncbi:MAG: Lrp/AsnC family transcriptional regulator [Candidatus Jordarchaeales archaeon]
MKEGEGLTDKQIQILKKLVFDGKPISVCTTYKSQTEISRELGITRQALNAHLKKLREKGYIRTGRGFIDVTERGLSALGEADISAFVLIKVNPHERENAYKKIAEAGATRIFRVTGEIDLIAEVNRNKLNSFLKKISQIEGVLSTEAHVILERLS